MASKMPQHSLASLLGPQALLLPRKAVKRTILAPLVVADKPLLPVRALKDVETQLLEAQAFEKRQPPYLRLNGPGTVGLVEDQEELHPLPTLPLKCLDESLAGGIGQQSSGETEDGVRLPRLDEPAVQEMG